MWNSNLWWSMYIDDIREISIPSERRREPKSATTEHEKTKIRAALGALSWCAQQSCPHLSAAVGLFLSQVRDSTVQTMVEINQLIYKTKCNRKHVLKVHGDLKVHDLLVAGWHVSYSARFIGDDETIQRYTFRLL